MGQTDPLENVRKAVQEEGPTVKPDYDFKFANKFEEKLRCVEGSVVTVM